MKTIRSRYHDYCSSFFVLFVCKSNFGKFIHRGKLKRKRVKLAEHIKYNLANRASIGIKINRSNKNYSYKKCK